MDNGTYLISKWQRQFIVTHYKADGSTEEFYVHQDKVLGPINYDSENEQDYIFGLEGLNGIFVTSKSETILTQL